MSVNGLQVSTKVKMQSNQTREGIARARSRGVEWGQHGKVLAEQHRKEADAFAKKLRPCLFEVVVHCGPRSTRIAKELNMRGVPARNGGRWYPATVDRLLKRLGPSFLSKARQAWGAKLDAQLKQHGIEPPNAPGAMDG